MRIDVQGHWDCQLTKEKLQSPGVQSHALLNQGVEIHDRVRFRENVVIVREQILCF